MVSDPRNGLRIWKRPFEYRGALSGVVTDVIDLSVNNLSGIEAEGNELAALQNRLDHFRELVVSGLMPADEGHALLDETEPQIAALRE